MLKAMRDWLADCDWADEPDFDAMPDWRIIAAVARCYDGGLLAFVRSMMPAQ